MQLVSKNCTLAVYNCTLSINPKSILFYTYDENQVVCDRCNTADTDGNDRHLRSQILVVMSDLTGAFLSDPIPAPIPGNSD
ncbi:hypothetical protein WA026_018819 [Henosepilachna vigintioctopunctata]|uniref:Uncharacterized protein n=1 Tax=Henosepilachna vigintioctopunctata TaxID=420089 RepID=A0AAW1TVP7_9CUCU